MARKQGKAGSKGKTPPRKLGVKKQPIKDLEPVEEGARRLKGGVRAGIWMKK